MIESIRAYALRYAALGLAVLPLHRPVDRCGRLCCSCGKAECPSPAKHPAGRLAPRGLLDASRDPNVIAAWFEREAMNLGIATGAASGIIVLDIDPRHGGDVSLAALERQHGALPSTWRFLTGGGGEHILFRHPGRDIRNSAGKLGDGIDVRGDGGYIVAPPSEHMSGRVYAIDVDHHPDDVPLAEMPPWLLEALADPEPSWRNGLKIGRELTDWRKRLAKPVGEGGRNIAVAQLAGLLLGRGLDPHVCLDLLLAYNDARHAPPLAAHEVVATIASIARRESLDRHRQHTEAGHG